MGKRGPSAQYAYGITIEAGNYNEVINGFEKRLKNLDKVTATTTKTFAALSEAMKSGKQVDFGKAEGQLTGLVAEMEEVAKWREQLAGGQKLSDMFDGLDQVKQSLGQITSQMDKFGDNIEEIFSILQNVPQNTSKTFIDVRKVLQKQASEMNAIIKELNNPTEKTDVSGLKKQLSSLATDFVNEWNKVTSQGVKMDQVVDFKPFATVIKSAISGARSLGTEFSDVSTVVTEAMKNVVALYSVKHPTGMFKDMVAGLSSVGAQSKKVEQTVVKFGSAFKAAISIADKFSKSDMGLAKKSKEMDEFLAKLKNPEITIDLKNKEVEEEFYKLADIYDDIVGANNITPEFLKNLPIDKLKELGSTLQNIIAMGKKFPEFINTDEDDEISILDAYGSDLKKVIEGIKTQLDEANAKIAESVRTLKSQLEALGLKDIELDVKLVDLTGDKVQEYVNQLNQFVDDLTGQLKNRGAIELPVNIQMPGITPDNADSKKAKDVISAAMDEYSEIAKDASKEATKNAKGKAMSKIISGAFGSNENLDLYLSYIKQQFSKIRETVKQQKREIQDMLSLDFTWNKGEASNSFSNLFVELQDYFADPENAIKVEIDSTYLKDGIKNAFKDAGGIDLKLPSSGTPMDQSQLAAAIVSAFRGSLPIGRQSSAPVTKQTTTSSSASPVTETDVKDRFVFNIKEFMSKYSGELSEGLNQTLENIVNSVRDVAKTANGSKVNQEVRAKIQAAFGSLDLSKVAEMTNEEIISWVQNALLKADESGRAIGADLPKVLDNTKVSWKSVSNFTNALNQLFIKIENETRDVEQAANERNKVAVLKDFGYRARAIDSKSAVVRKLGNGEVDTDFLKSQMERLQSVKAYKDSIGEEGSKIVKWLDSAIAIYQKLINISNGTTTFNTEAEKQEEITKLRDELSKIRVSDDKSLIETLSGEITVSKKYKNGTKSRGQRKGFTGSSRSLEKALSLIEKTGDDGVITIKFTSGPNDKAFKEWIESENEYGKTVNTLRRSKDNNLRGESKSSLISPKEDKGRLLDQKIDFKPFLQSRKPIDLDGYESDLQIRLQENEEALAKQQKIVDEARKNLTSAKRVASSSSKKVYSGSGDINDEWIAKEEDILKLATEDKNSGLNDKSIKQLSKLVKSSYSKDSKSFKKAYATAQKDLESLMSKDATEDNVAQVKSLLDFINSLNRAAENYTSVAKYVDEKFVINKEIDESLFESASKRVSDAGEIKVKSKGYKGTKLPQTNVSKLVSGIKRKESIEEFSSYSSVYQEYIKSLLDSALTDLNETVQGKDTSANRKKIQSILQYIDNLKKQFDQFKEIEQKIYEAYNFGKTKKDVKFENLSSVDDIIENYKTGKEILQRKIEEIDEQLAYLDKQKGNIKHYTDEQKVIAKLQLDASNYYSGISKVKQLEYNFNNAQTEQEKEKFAQLLQSAKSQNANDASKNIGNVIKFIEELESKLSDKKISEQDRNTLSSVLQEAQSLFKELNVANVTGKTPLFQMSQSRYEDIIANNSAEAERIAEAEKKALTRRAKAVEKLNDFEANSPGAEALRRVSSVKSGESYRSKSVSTQIDKTNAQSIFNESEERLRVLEKEKEALQAEKEKVAEKKKYNNLLIQEKKLKEEIAAADKAGVSSEEKKAELTKLQEKIAKQEKKLGINFEEVSSSMTKEKAFDKASEYDAQEKLLRSQVKALESKVESAQELINSLTARGFNSAKGEAELRRFTNDRVADFRSSDYFRTKKDEIRDKYLKGVYKEDGTLDSSDSLEGKIRELADKYSKDIDKIFFNIADVKEGNAQEFLNGLIGDQTRFSNAFKGNNDVGQKFMADYEEFKSFYWELIKEEENKVVDDYKKSIKVDKHNGTVSYTSYDGDTIQEVVVDLKSQIIQGLKEQIEAELMPTLSEKTGLLGRVSDSKKQALDFAGLKESDIRNIDVDSKIVSLKSDIESLKSTNISAKDRDIEGAKQRDLERQKSIIEEIEDIDSRITSNVKDQIKLERELNVEKENYLKSINKDGSKSDAGKIAIERLKTNATAEYVNSDDYKSQVEAINNKYYGKGENGKSLFDESIDKIVPKYKDAIYRILSKTSKYTEEEIDGFLKLIQDNPELYSSSDAYFKLGKTKNAEMAKTLSNNSERVWSNLVREYSSIKGSVEDGIERDIKALIKNYRDSFEINNDNNTVSYTSYANGKTENVVRNLKETLLSVIEQEIVDILSGKNIDSIVNDAVGSKAKDLYSKRNSAIYLQKQLEGLKVQKQVIESRIANGTLSEEDQKEVDKQLKEKKAIGDKIAVLEEEIEAWEFVKKAREEARELDRKTDQEREATELSKIERYEQGITDKKEKQRKLQEELNLLRGEEVKDVDVIERKESELEEVTNKITELEGKKQKSEGKLGRIRERIENAPVVSETGYSSGGILSPIVNLLTEIRDILSKISGIHTKSGGNTSGSSPSSGGKTKSEINSMLSKYWYKKNGKSATQEEWKQLKQDYVDGKLTDLDEILAQEVQAKIEKEKKEDTKPVAKKNDTKKSDDRFSNILRLAGFRDENNKAIQLASKSTDEFLSDAQALYDEVKKWSGDKTSDEYLAKQLRLGKTLTALRSSLPRTYSGKNGYTNAEEWANYLSENGLSGAMESSIKNQKNLKAVIENGVAVVAEEVVEQGVEEGKKVAEEPKQESTSKKQKYAGGPTWSKTKDAIKNGANKPEDGLSLEEYITKAQSLYNEINSWVGEKNIEYFSKRLELGSVMQKAAVAVKQANPDKKFKNTDLYNYFAKQYNMENVNSLALTSTKLDGNKDIMAALADVKPVDTTPVTQAVENTDNAVVEHVAEIAKTVEEEVKQTTEQQKQVELSNAEKLKLARKEVQRRLDIAKGIAQDGTKSNSKEVIKPESIPSIQNPEHIFNEGVESTEAFVKEVWKLTEAFKAGANVANIEYGFATQNGKRVQLAKGDNGSVDFKRFYGDVDSLTHSHSYTKGLNNMIFSLADIDQLETLGTKNNLKKYNLIYDNEMMSLNFGKNSQEAAEAIADCYPQINDIVSAMLSREDGNSIPAENSDEMARILNGYLQRVVEDAGGRLSVVNSKGENVTSKYSITDDEYSKLNNVLSKFQGYYDANYGEISKSDYIATIRQYLAEEFGKEYMSNVYSKSNINPHGGIVAEYSPYDDELLAQSEQITLHAKKVVEAQEAWQTALREMTNEDLLTTIRQLENASGVNKEPEIKPTLTKAQIAALNPDDVTALQKASIKQFSKVRNWNENNVGNIEEKLGVDNKTLVAYKTQFEELAKIALDLKTKGESGTIITKDDISQLDTAIAKTKELQSELTKEAQLKQMKDASLIVSGKTKIKSTDSYSERQDIMAQYAKKYATQNKSEYQFGQYDFINDKISFNMIDSAGQVTKVIMGWSEAFNSAYIQSSKLQGSLDKITQEVYKTDEAIKVGEEYGFFQEQSEGVKAYKDALAEYEAQVKAVSKSSQKDLAQNFEALHTAQEKVINAGKDLLDKQKDAYGFNNAQKVIGRTGDVDAVLQNYRDQGINVNDVELVKNYNDAIAALNDKVKTLKENGKLWDHDEQSGLKLLADRAIEAEKALLKADEAQRQLNGEVIKGKNAKFFEGVDPNNVDQVKQAMEQYARSINGVDAQSIKWNEDQRALSYSVRTGKNEVSDFTIGVKELTNEFYEARTGTRAVKTGMEEFLGSIGDKFKEVGRYLLSFGSFYRVWGEIQKGVTYIKEIDSALTELKKVTDETDATYAQFLNTMSKTGAEVGATVQDLTNMAANWARLGYSIEEAGELAKSTAVLLNVSEFTDADSASEALISTMQAYGYAAEDSMHVVDVLNEIGNNFAISSDGIATALQDSASSLMAAGNNLEQSVAMIAAANKVLQDPNSVGAALRTISLRIRGTSVKQLEEIGEETDGVIESVSKLQAKVKGLSGVDILTDTGAYKDTYTIIKEIGQVWDQMNDINRAALLELLAGKNRSNAMAALLTNMEDLEGAYEDAMAAQGSAEAENEKYMNSIQGRIDQFTNALQTMWKNAIDSNFVKFIVSVGTGLVKVVNWLGMIPTILGTISGAMSAIKGQNLFVSLTGNGKSGIITELIQKVKEGIPAIKEFNSIQGVDNQAKFLNSLKETNPELSNYITKVMSASAVTTENGVATNIASVSQKRYIGSLVAAKAASIGLKVATVALNAALTIGISLLISGAISAISKVINGVKETKEETKKLTEELKQQQAEIKSNISSLESLKDEFDKLSKGVDEYGNNISLSTEEYAKYKSIVEQVLEYTPTLISGYDEEGNAIANKNSLIEKSIELLKEERKQKLLDLVTDDKLKVSYNASKETYDKAEERFKNINMPSTLAYSGVKIDDNGKEHSGYVNQIDKYIEDVIGVEKNASESISEYIARNYDAVRKNIGKIIERSGQTKDGWKGINDKQQTELLSYLNNVLSGVREMDASWNSFIQTLQLVPQTSAYYDKLSDSQKSFIASYINGIDDLENKTEEEVSSIKNGILSLTNAIGSDEEAQSLIDQLFSIDSNLSAKEYSDKISEIFNKLVEKGTISNDDKQKFIEQLFPDLKDIETMQEDVKKKIKDGQQDLVNSLNAQDLKIAYSIDASNISFDELKKKIQDVKVANIGDFNISDYSDSISSLSENIGVLQAALEKLNSGQFTMDDYVKLIKDFPKLAKGVDVSSKSFKGLTSNLVRTIKASPKSLVKDLKALKLQLMQTGRSTSDIDQLIYSLEHMPENALDSMITKYSTLADTITEATEAQNELKAAMEENPNEGFETRGEAMDYMKEAMSRGEIGSESNLWNVAEKYGFTFDSAKSINENADALAKFIATREKWFKQDDDGNYTYEGTEDFIKKVDAAVASMPELQELMKWDYNESTGVLDFDFKNKDWDQIVKYLSTCEGLIGLTSDEWADMLIQVGQYFNIDWSNYNDELEYLKKITTEDTDNKTKVEKYGSTMQEYFGKDSSIDLANRPMISSSKMKAKGWKVEDGSYSTVDSVAFSNEAGTAAITVTPILPDGEVLTEKELTKYATEIVNGADPATYEFEVNGKTYTGEDIILAKHNGKDPVEEAKEYGKALHEAQEEYDKLRDTLNINTTIDEKGINGLSEIKEIQGAIQKNADGTTIIDEQAFRKALTSAEYTEDQIDLIIDKIKALNKEAFASDTFNIGKILDKETGSGIDGLLEIKELQDAIKKDANTGFTVIDTDMFTSVLSEAGYTKAQIDELIQKIQEYENVVSVAGNTDPLGLSSANLSIDTLKASLSTLGVFFEDTLGDWFDGKRDLVINVPDLVSTLKEKGWTEEAIRSYCEQLSKTNIEGFNIKVNSQEIDEALAKSDDVPEEKTTNYEVTGNGATTLDGIENTWSNVTKDKTTNYTINETTVKKTVDDSPKWYKPWTWFADGTANAQGNWGAERTETSLVGELGPELRVRGSRWEMLGENGAEFTDVKKGDIIFNHKQTEELLKNGHITGRGRAYANGTAYAAGGGTFARYGFSGNGGYTKYDVNNSIVDSFGNAADSISDAADSVSDAADDFEEVFDWFEVLLEEIEDNISLMNARLENAVGISAKKGIYSEIINTEQFKLQELYEGIKLYSDYANKLLAKVPDQYKEMAKNGAVAITDFLGEANEEVVESINNYREWAKKVTDLNQQLEETKKAIADTHVEIQNMLKDEYDNRISLITSVNDRIQDTIDLLDEEGKRSSAVMYEEMIKNSTKQLSELQSKRAEMQRALDEAVSSGDVARESSQWYEMVNAINDVDGEINDCRINLEGFQNSINQLHWDNFEKFIDAIDNVGNEISNLGDLIDEEDVVDEVGNWTDKGVTALGLYAQEMERAKYRAEQYGKEIEYLNQEYAAGKYSEDEYLEKLQELKDGQWDSIKSYESAKKSIIDLNKTRIEAVKDGIQKEIDAYSELIDKKKEELSLQKDAHDFQKQVTEKQKEIADIQKKLAVMSGDNSASAIAQKKKLQAELAAAQEELDELYYNHSVEKQQEALDKSLENYQDNKQNEMDALDESLKNEEQIIADSYATITANTESVAQTLSDIASQYGITLSDSVMQPWLDGANAIGTYQEQLDTSMSSFTQQLETLKKMYSDLQAQADSTGKSMIDAINSNKSKTESSTYTPPAPSQPSAPSTPSAPYNGATVTVKRSATHFSRDGGNGTRMQSWVPGSDFTVYQVSGSDVLIGRNGGYTGWVRLSDLEGYASGTKGISKDQLAMLDELGDELVLHAGKNGRLEFLTKGTSVIPSDITENLMKLGSLDPRQVLDNNRPSIGAPHIVNNSMEINMQIAEVVHIDHADNSSIPDITKAVQNQIDAYMSKVNSSLRRYTR